MKLKKYDTKAYLLSDDAIADALEYFRRRALELSKKNQVKVVVGIDRGYNPTLRLAALKRQGLGGAQNVFHLDLNDLGIVCFHEKHGREKIMAGMQKDRLPPIEKNTILPRIGRLKAESLSMLGWLFENGTTNVGVLDMQKQRAVRELVGMHFAKRWDPASEEGELKSLIREVLNWDRVTKVEYVKPNINIPFFSSKAYDISRRLQVSDIVEADYEKKPINHSPSKLKYLLGTLFSCDLSEKELVYLPYMQCTFSWPGGNHVEILYPACFKELSPHRYEVPERLKTVNIGTKGSGMNSTAMESVSIDFKDVAGMDDLKEEIRQSIIYPLLKPELAEEYGKKGGGGVLFYGPPGCGKTYLVRATVGETGYNFYVASIQDIVGLNPAQGAKALHNVFMQARQGAPSILFFDEIDALGGKREDAQGGGERMIINQFLTEMEGVGSGNRDVLIIGASNAPWDIDPALRRSGRFTTQIFIPPPDDGARKALFRLHLKERPLADDLDFDELSRLGEEYSSADITAICEEAAKIPWTESVHGGERRGIRMDDFRQVFNTRDATLTAWLRLAEKEIRKSGEYDLYPKMADYVFKRAGGIEAAEKPELKFGDVSGLSAVKEEIKAKVIYPLVDPDLAEEYGRTVGGGILLYGPPGCGKTFIARATAGETGAYFYNVKLTDLLSPQEGEAEKRLHAIFERASRNTPSIIFFDEIDAVAGQRSSKKTGVERRIVNQFLTEMDGFEKKEGVMILAATNTPWDIDPALRRPGRFSTHIFLPPPDEESRKAMFKSYLSGRPVADDVDFERLAASSVDYSAADIANICSEAAKIPWKERMDGLEKRSIRMNDILAVLNSIKPSIGPWLTQAEKEIRGSGEVETYHELAEYVFKRAGGVEAARRPSLRFSDVGGLDEVKEEIKAKIVYPLVNPKLAMQYGRKIGGGLLLYGPPGCGKTFIAKATAGEAGAYFYNIKLTDIISSEEGETEKRLHAIFERASRNTPSIIFFDEIDAVAGQRSSRKTGSERRLVNQFLTEMDGFEKKKGVMILAATNTPWDIDPALRRPGRFSDQVFLPAPDADGRRQVLELNLKGKPVSGDVDVERLTELTSGYSAADLANIVEDAAKIPWRQAMDGDPEREVSMSDFKSVIESRDSSLIAWFRQVEKELVESGEQEAYPALSAALADFRSRNRSAGRVDPELARQKARIEREIELLKGKLDSGEISQKVFDDLMVELEKRLLEIEVNMPD